MKTDSSEIRTHRLFAASILLLMLCLFTVTAYGADECVPLSGSNAGTQDYDRWTSTVNSYLFDTGTGIDRVEYMGNALLIQHFDDNYQLQSSHVSTLSDELPIFGGVYYTGGKYYLVTGQKNTVGDSVETYRISRYDSDLKNKERSASLYGANTMVPFDAGSLRMTDDGSHLVIRTCHKMYNGHQASVMIYLDMATMTITDSMYSIGNVSRGYVSHSFNQFVAMDGSSIVAVDHIEGSSERGIVLMKYNEDQTHPVSTSCNYVMLANCIEAANNPNITGASLGGFVVTPDSYLVAYNSVLQEGDIESRKTRNVYVASVDKNLSQSSVKVTQLTDYAEGEASTTTPVLTDMGDGTYMVSWTRGEGRVYYTLVDSKGSQKGEIYEQKGDLSDCAPLVKNGNVYWYTSDNDNMEVYSISTGAPGTISTQTIENEHTYELQDVTDGLATLKCKKDGAVKQYNVPVSVMAYWNTVGTSGSYSGIAKRQKTGTRVYYLVTATYKSDSADEDWDNVVIESSDPEVLLPDKKSIRVGRGAMLTGSVLLQKPGVAKVTFRPQYNPGAAVTKEFVVFDPLRIDGFAVVDEDGNESASSSFPFGEQVMLRTKTSGGIGQLKYTYVIRDMDGNQVATYTSQNANAGSDPPGSDPVQAEDTVAWESPAVGEYRLEVTVTNPNDSSETGTQTAGIDSFKIVKAPAPQLTPAEVAVPYGRAKSGQEDVAALLPEDRGTTTYSVQVSGESGIVETVSVSEDGMLTYQIPDSTQAFQEAVLTVNAVSENYEDTTFEVHISILDRYPISNALITFEEGEWVYTGSAHTPAFTVTYEGTVLTEGTDYTIESWTDNINASTDTTKACVTIAGTGDYGGTKTESFIIGQVNIKDVIVLKVGKNIYTGEPLTPKPAVAYDLHNGTDPLPLTEGTDFDLQYSDNINVGTATVIMTGKGNFTGERTYHFTIDPASIAGANVTGITAESVYTGDPITQDNMVVKMGETVLQAGTDYEVSYTQNIDVGTAGIVITGKGNYEGAVSKLSFEIVPLSITDDGIEIEVECSGWVYTGSEIRPPVAITRNGAALVENKDYEVKYGHNLQATTGTNTSASISIDGIGNYTDAMMTFFRIEQAPIENVTVAPIADYTYTGEKIEPAISAAYGDVTLEDGKDYTVSYANNVEPGEATATLTAQEKSNFTGTKQVTFRIAAGDLADADLQIDTGDGLVYNGKAQQPAVKVTMHTGASSAPGAADGGSDGDAGKERVLKEGTDYKVSYADNTDAGENTARVTVTGIGFYTGEQTGTFTIAPADLADLDESGLQIDTGSGLVYNSRAQEPAVTVSIGGVTIDASNYTAAYVNNVNAGSEAKVTLKGQNNLKGERSLTFAIAPASLAKAQIGTAVKTVIFDTEPKTPELTVMLALEGASAGDDSAGMVSLKAGTDYECKAEDYTDNVNAGTAHVTIRGIGNYTDSAKGTFTIDPADIAQTRSAAIDPVTYSGAAHEPAPTLTFGKDDAYMLAGGVDFAYGKENYENNINAGTARLTVSGKGNFRGTKQIEFTIAPASIKEAAVTGMADPVIYTGDAITQDDLTVTLDGNQLKKDTDYTLAYSGNTNVGTAKVSIEGILNYKDVLTKEFSIKPRSIDHASVKVNADEASLTYTGSALTPGVTVTLDDKVLDAATDYSVIYDNNVNAGTGFLNVTGKGNYTGIVIAKTYFTINKAPLSDASIAAIADQTYTGDEIKPAVTVTFGGMTLQAGTDYDAAYEGNVEVGTATVTLTAKDDSNFSGTASATFRIVEKTEPQPDDPGDQPGGSGGQGSGELDGSGGQGSSGKPDDSQKPSDGAQDEAAAAAANGPVGAGTNAEKAQKALESLGAGTDDVNGMTFGILQARFTKVKKNAITIKWKKVPGAVAYKVMGNQCGQKYKLLNTVKTGSFKYTKLKKGKYYKVVIIAVDARGRTIATSKSIHVATKGGKVGNDKKVTVNKKKVTLKKGKKFKIKAKAVHAGGVKVKRHRKIAFESSDPKVATVNKKGKVTAKAKGKCTIYCYAQDGVFAKVKIKVK